MGLCQHAFRVSEAVGTATDCFVHLRSGALRIGTAANRVSRGCRGDTLLLLPVTSRRITIVRSVANACAPCAAYLMSICNLNTCTSTCVNNLMLHFDPAHTLCTFAGHPLAAASRGSCGQQSQWQRRCCNTSYILPCCLHNSISPLRQPDSSVILQVHKRAVHDIYCLLGGLLVVSMFARARLNSYDFTIVLLLHSSVCCRSKVFQEH